MALDDFLDGEVAIAAGITAAVLSPRVRNVVRRGAVLGLAGVMTAGDAVVGAAKGAASEARERASADGDGPPKSGGSVQRTRQARAET
jgi:hypothetical protein